MKRHLSLLMILCWGILLHAQTESELSSPNGEIKVTLNITDKIYYSIAYDGDVLLKDNSLQLALKDEVLGQNPRLRRRKYVSVDEQLTPVMPLKFSTVTNQYNQLTLTFKNYSVEFRAYDAVPADEFPDIETAAPDSHSRFVPKTFPDNRRAADPAPSAVLPCRPFPRFVSKQSADSPALHPMPAAPQEAAA